MDNDISNSEHYRRQAEHLQERVEELEQSLVAAKRRPLPSTFDAMMCMMGTIEAVCSHLGVPTELVAAQIDARYASLELLPPDQRGEPEVQSVPIADGETFAADPETGACVMPRILNPFTDLPHGGGA